MMDYRHAWAAYHAELERRGTGPASIDSYRKYLAVFVAFLDSSRPPVAWDQVGDGDVQAYLRRRCRPGRRGAGQPLAPRTRALYAATIRDFYRTLYAADLLDSDPLRAFRPPRRPAPSERPLDLADVARLLRHVADHPDPRLELLAHLCYYTLLRAGETTLLQVADVDLDGTDGRTPQLLVVGKGRQHRESFPLHPAAIPPVVRYLTWLCARHGVGAWRDLPAGTPLVQDLRAAGKPVGRAYASTLLAAAMREAGVPGRPHDLRRTAAWWVGECSGDSQGQLMAVLRHVGTGALQAYRRPPLATVARYLAQVPVPPGP